MKAVHFICRRDESGSLRNLRFDRNSHLYHSGKWDITEEAAAALVGGWLYLHPRKADASEFGGTVEGFKLVRDDTAARTLRIELLVRKQPQGTGQPWRGQAHGMAWTSGLVSAGFAHETAGGR